MTDLEQMTEFRDYAAPADRAALDRAHRAVRVAARAATPPKRRHRARRAGLVLAGAVAATCVVAFLPGQFGGPDRGPARGTLGTADAATISARARAAIDAANGILLTTTRDRFARSGHVLLSKEWIDLRDSSAFRTWEDRRSTHLSGSGFGVEDSGQIPVGRHSILERTVTDGRCDEVLWRGGGGGASSGRSDVASKMRFMSRHAEVSVEVRHGVRLLHLSTQDGADFWVDASTYLPVRAVARSGDPKAGAGEPNEVQVMTSRFEVLPRPSSVASVMLPPVPAGETCTRSTRHVELRPPKRPH